MWDLQLVVFSEQTVDVIEASLTFCSLSRTNFMRDVLARGRGSVNFQDLHWFSDLTIPCSTILGFMACSQFRFFFYYLARYYFAATGNML
jgi:hypothetical protein